MLKSIPLGVENFKRLVEEDFYFVDKTLLIKELLDTKAMVNLFARPRRFGKTLSMSMLRYFFEQTEDNDSNMHLFHGLKIADAGEKYMKHMGKYPVISISLKSVEQGSFSEAFEQVQTLLADEFERHSYILDSDRISARRKKAFQLICDSEAKMTAYQNSLKLLADCLCAYYKKKVIVLIDEYDVPLQNAWLHGFYDEMIEFIRLLFGNVLKTNDSLEFGVLSGCLRISKESIFTGLNNLKVFSISDTRFSSYFGFTDADVQEILSYYSLDSHYDEAKEWYDGYRFGKNEMYCPWDVLNYCSDLLDDDSIKPKPYWVNTSSNDIVRQFISSDNATVRDAIEQLLAGKAVRKKINQELTYRDLKDNKENVWSMLYMTGYLTHEEILDNGEMTVVIPNRQIWKIFEEQIKEWFKAYIADESMRPDLTKFCMAFKEKDAEQAQEMFTLYMHRVISIRDNNVRDELKENFYQGIMVGLLSFMDEWKVRSSEESGDGYCDITVRIPAEKIGIIIELKFREDEKMEEGVDEALKQIEEKRYDEVFADEGYTTVIKYGMACYKKRCRIKLG